MAFVCRSFSLPLPPSQTTQKPRLSRAPVVSALSNEELRRAPARGTPSALESRVSLVLALVSQATTATQRRLEELAEETAKYALPRRYEARNFEEALMSVPNLETVKYRVLKQTEQYEIREVEPYYVAETTMPSRNGFDFNGASQSFNVLASYLFGKNTGNEQMEMTTPVYTQKVESSGKKMDMTTPVITKRSSDQEKWQMSFVMPSKYGSNLPLPKDQSVTIKEVRKKIVAVTAFSGFVTDEDVSRRESKLREALKTDLEFQLKDGALVEVAQFNPPFTLPFTRRNEIALEVERITK
ncbi:SOUL heme-binding protein [Rhynchospora pubera]|uniref:SOUL heme-binding protein n=1 Tax=Rhynchospora pubera TaxID=906938 RepID=A0AAV8FQ35_9POAL|nr:SOUL heme-binding protein [Rhynchospora pubera]